MDYDAYDAILHHIFKQTQGDAWFKAAEDNISSGVCIRVEPGVFRVFPYENPYLEPFEAAVKVLNPEVAVKTRSAAVHAALAQVAPNQTHLDVDSRTRIQILDDIAELAQAEKGQGAAFIRDERVLVVWSDRLDDIIPEAQSFEARLIKLAWRTRSTLSSNNLAALARAGAEPPSPSAPGTLARSSFTPSAAQSATSLALSGVAARLGHVHGLPANLPRSDTPEPSEAHEKDTLAGRNTTPRGTEEDVEAFRPPPRPPRMFAPVYNGIAAGLAIFFVGNGVKILLVEFTLDHDFTRFAICAVLPLIFCVSLFFCLQIVNSVSFVLGPVAQYHQNSKYYSAIPPLPIASSSAYRGHPSREASLLHGKEGDNALAGISGKARLDMAHEVLPHITIQMPVYKESLDATIGPSVESIQRAMLTYARQGGTSSIFVCDDGMQVLPPAERDARIAYYAAHDIGWVARPRHSDAPGGFRRAGRFKKASNMNYALKVSLRMEEILLGLEAGGTPAGTVGAGTMSNGAAAHLGPALSHAPGGRVPTTPISAEFGGRPGFAHANTGSSKDKDEYGTADDKDGMFSGALGMPGIPIPTQLGIEERALGMAVAETNGEAWAAGGKALRMGEVILLVDSDTQVPEDCLRDAARELAECPEVAIIQHESDVMQVAHHYFENGIAYFTRRINHAISVSCANGEVAPFVGHNAFLRWSAIQEAAFTDTTDGQKKFWSEAHVSEDFDMALRLQLKGYTIRWATYSKGGFKEGVSLTCDDELNRWQKYSYGCSELLFNPIHQWIYKGPVTRRIHEFIWSPVPLHYKISVMSYMFSYYGIAAAMTLSVMNYLILGWQFPIDGFYMHSFEIWLATTVVFLGAGNLGMAVLEYRLGKDSLINSILLNLKWLPFFFFFFGGLSLHLSAAVLSHLFHYNMTWGATKKEVEASNFFMEVPRILKRFWLTWLISWLLVAGVIILSLPIVPVEWRIGADAWAVIFPLAVQVGCHILYPIILNPWLLLFSY